MVGVAVELGEEDDWDFEFHCEKFKFTGDVGDFEVSVVLFHFFWFDQAEVVNEHGLYGMVVG